MSKIKDFLGKVYETNEFYKNIASEYNITDPTDITQYPILTRQQLQENRYNMFSEGYKNKYFSQSLHRQFSSGTTGMPVNVYWDYNDYGRSMLALWRKRYQYYDILPHHKSVKFTLSAFNSEPNENILHRFDANSNTLFINRPCLKTDNNYREVLSLISDFSPEWLYVQPFILKKLLYYYQHFDVKPPKSLRYIESLGEILSAKLRKDAKNFFGVPVANMYGSEEMNGIAYECPYHKMHILENNVLVECMDESGIYGSGEGESIITNFNNKAMPLIRYNQGDIISIEKLKEPCLCGSKSLVIGIIKGRMHSSIQCDGFEINSFLLLETIDELNNQFNDPIRKYKFVYFRSSKKLMCYISVKAINKLWIPKIIEQLDFILKSKLLCGADILFEIEEYKFEESIKEKFDILEIKE